MRGGGGKKAGPRRTRPAVEPPVPLEPVDLLAGLAPGLELQADDLPPGIGEAAPSDQAVPARLTVAEAGKLIRSGDGTVRRLIRTEVLTPADPDGPRSLREIDRAGVPPRSSDKPGE